MRLIIAIAILTACAHIGAQEAKNDVPAEVVSLPAYSTATDADFFLYVTTREGYVLVEFYADWCGPCQAFAPEFEKVSEQMHSADLSFVKVDVDKSPKTVVAQGVKSIPKLLLFKDGKLVGECPERNGEKVKKWLKTQMSISPK